MQKSFKTRLRRLEKRWNTGIQGKHFVIVFFPYHNPPQDLGHCPHFQGNRGGSKGRGITISLLRCEGCKIGCNPPSESVKAL